MRLVIVWIIYEFIFLTAYAVCLCFSQDVAAIGSSYVVVVVGCSGDESRE